MTMPDERITMPVPVEIKNWATPVKPPFVKNTTLKTYLIDPANVNAKNVQICDYEPRRLRMAIQVLDNPVALLVEPPVTSPDVSTPTVVPQGLVMPVNVTAQPYEFFGPDAFWLNALTTVSRVTVLKEYS